MNEMFIKSVELVSGSTLCSYWNKQMVVITCKYYPDDVDGAITYTCIDYGANHEMWIDKLGKMADVSLERCRANNKHYWAKLEELY